MVGARTSCIACIYCQTFLFYFFTCYFFTCYFYLFFIVTCIPFLYFSLYYAYLQLPFGSHSPDEPVTIRSTSRADAPFVLWLHGMSDRESYAHPLGYHIESPEVQGLSFYECCYSNDWGCICSKPDVNLGPSNLPTLELEAQNLILYRCPRYLPFPLVAGS